MNGRRAIAGLCMLSALLVSAFAAQGASAASNGTTAFTCVSTAPKLEFKTEHCKPGVPDQGTAFGHEKIEEGEKTHITFSNANTNSETNGPTPHTLKSTVAGLGISPTSNQVHCTGFQENKKEGVGQGVEGEHYIHGTEIVCTFSEVVETTLHCTVTGVTAPGGEKMISTVPLTATTTAKGDTITLSPASGNVFAKFKLTKCEGLPDTEITVFGSLTCEPSGATINCTHATVTGSKQMRIQNATTGPVAGYEGSVTVIGGKEKLTEPTHPLSVTTVETA